MSVVFHLDEGDSRSQSELLGNLKNLRKDPTIEVDKIAVVLNGDAVEMVEKGSEASSFVKDEIDEDVKFYACSNSLENRDIDEILEDVESASSGVGKLAELQQEGFNYIKP